jgi:hypothetical protein
MTSCNGSEGVSVRLVLVTVEETVGSGGSSVQMVVTLVKTVAVAEARPEEELALQQRIDVCQRSIIRVIGFRREQTYETAG